MTPRAVTNPSNHFVIVHSKSRRNTNRIFLIKLLKLSHHFPFFFSKTSLCVIKYALYNLVCVVRSSNFIARCFPPHCFLSKRTKYKVLIKKILHTNVIVRHSLRAKHTRCMSASRYAPHPQSDSKLKWHRQWLPATFSSPFRRVSSYAQSRLAKTQWQPPLHPLVSVISLLKPGGTLETRYMSIKAAYWVHGGSMKKMGFQWTATKCVWTQKRLACG